MGGTKVWKKPPGPEPGLFQGLRASVSSSYSIPTTYIESKNSRMAEVGCPSSNCPGPSRGCGNLQERGLPTSEERTSRRPQCGHQQPPYKAMIMSLVT